MTLRLAAVLAALMVSSVALNAQEPAAGGQIVMKDVLLLPNVATSGRTWLREDAHEAALVHVGTESYIPSPGDSVTAARDTEVQWFEASAQDDGWVTDDALRGGYAYWGFESPQARVMILAASGHSMVYVNGIPRVGDAYETGYVRVPVLLRNGMNALSFRGSRGRVRATLFDAPPSGVELNTADATLGDAAAGTTSDWFGAVVLLNATREPLTGLQAVVEGDAAHARPIPAIPPLGLRKVVFTTSRAWGEPGERELNLQIIRPGTQEPLASAPVRIRIRDPKSGETFKHTFFSAIDGSLQYYAARSATQTPSNRTGLVLTLHGASVEASGQADAYAPKPDFHIVAPTNRRPYGFDWEDWGRMDALEVLADASRRFTHDPSRVYLTGHSMGGHGTWQLGALFPGKFAAIAPSAGWPTFWTYTERSGQAPWDINSPESLMGMVQRGARTSDTLALIDNYRGLGVYILHGDKDDNVPVEQARLMKDLLTKAAHPEFGYHEQPGAGHWWGNECVDWAPIFELFRKRTIPPASTVNDIVFVTADPSVSSALHWLRIEAQIQRLVPTRIEARLDRAAKALNVTTQNAAAVAFDLGAMQLNSVSLTLDGERLPDLKPASSGLLHVRRTADGWKSASGPSSPVAGPFKRAFDRNFVLVYATRGTAEENTHALAAARFHAETWWYRGNGSCDLIADDDFDPDTSENRDRNVILYGNADINSAWRKLVPDDAPAQVSRGRVVVGERTMEEDLLGVLFVCPRKGSAPGGPVVGVIGGTAAQGLRSLDRAPIFTSGVGFPDLLVVGADMLQRGADGIRTIGFYGPDGTLKSGHVINQKGFDMPGELTE